MFSKYFLSELAYLREMGRAFGLANPSVAGMLVERGADPDVERLLEGFAFLTARIRERVDDDVPEMVHVLTDLLLPHYLRPVPASTIIEFTPQVRALRGRSTVPAGVEIAARPLDGTSCVFRTTSDVELLPLTLEEAMLDKSSVTAPVLRLFFQAHEQIHAEIFRPEGLRLFIHAELATSALMLLWLMRYCRGVEVRNEYGKSVQLGARRHPRLWASTATSGCCPGPAPPRATGSCRSTSPCPRSSSSSRCAGWMPPGPHGATASSWPSSSSALPRSRPAWARRCSASTARPPSTCSPPPRTRCATPCCRMISCSGAEGVEPRHMEVFSVDSVTGLQVGTERAAPLPALLRVRPRRPGRARSRPSTGCAGRPLPSTTASTPTSRWRRRGMCSPSLAEETLSIALTCTQPLPAHPAAGGGRATCPPSPLPPTRASRTSPR